MDPKETAASYDALADFWNGADFDRENGIEAHERALRFAPREGRALDVGCGSSGRVIELLLARGFAVEGLDISAKMLAHARARHPQAHFHHADIVSWAAAHRYAFISAWDSIWHVPLADQRAVLEKLCRALAPAGVLIFTTGGIEQPEARTNLCMGQPLYHAALGLPNLLGIADGTGCVCRHLEYDQPEGEGPGSHVYLIFQRT